MSTDTNPNEIPFPSKSEQRRAVKEGKKNAKQMLKAAPGDGIPVTMSEIATLAKEAGVTPVDGGKFRRALLALREKKRQEDGETVQSLTFDQVWSEFVTRKKSYLKRHGKRPTGVVIGQIEAAIFANNKEKLEERKMIRTEKGEGGGLRLFVNNMWAVVSDQQSCIAPFHIEIDLTKEVNPYQNL